MSDIALSDAHRLGLAPMDDIHHEFMHLMARLDDAGRDDMMACLDALIEHTEAHFAQEQQWMEESGFPPVHCHHGEHERVLEVVREVRRLAAAGDHGIVRSLVRELPQWFAHHAATMDAMLAEHIARSGYIARATLERLVLQPA
ncbi:hemerythrin domain-containing protein [Methyloversatilis thermotolerans]|uniref:hemerythrin domain-containing protein n=1 Tax=Methyloversatilis thermotolerans TaxID=1346290 RepID=UPI00035F8EB3|nr:hemerythrin domain-containing protein [Methyloversatilis thermotolerans]